MIGVRLPKKLLRAVDRCAKVLFPFTRSEVIRRAVEEWFTPAHLRVLPRAKAYGDRAGNIWPVREPKAQHRLKRKTTSPERAK
jgi:hypothetical protein